MKPLRSLIGILGILTLVIVSWTCEDDTGNLNDIVFPASNVSYGQHVEPLFLRGCAYSGCHDVETRANGLSLENYQDAISSKPGTILPGDTSASRLLWSIQGKFGSTAMPPPPREQLNSNQVQGLKTWIKEGARNN